MLLETGAHIEAVKALNACAAHIRGWAVANAEDARPVDRLVPGQRLNALNCEIA